MPRLSVAKYRSPLLDQVPFEPLPLKKFVGRFAVHSETEIRSLCSEINVSADRETSPLFPRMVSELKMRLCQSLALPQN